ncbi:hypothetical protein [Rhodococcus koreensis]|uniref:hypothetical protein n=1 Tax=Rhodococcus koreensis TaxID=99653 RepID=UPI00366DA91B
MKHASSVKATGKVVILITVAIMTMVALAYLNLQHVRDDGHRAASSADDRGTSSFERELVDGKYDGQAGP